MRYIVIKKENSSPEIVIWAKSQYRDSKNRECSHRDYLRNNHIPFEKVLSIGNVSYDPKTGKSNVEALPWDGPEKKDDPSLIQKAVVEFYKGHPELASEIQENWNQYQAWLKQREELLAGLRRG